MPSKCGEIEGVAYDLCNVKPIQVRITVLVFLFANITPKFKVFSLN